MLEVIEPLIVVEVAILIPGPAPAPDANLFLDDDDDVEGYGCLSSLFDTDFGDGEDDNNANDDAINDISGMTSFSTAGAAAASSSETQEDAVVKKPLPPQAPSRRPSSFISSLFGGFGGISAAPHGYKSVVGSLQEFTKSETLEGDNAYGCEECTRREKVRIALHRRNGSVMVKGLAPSSERCHDVSTGDSVSREGTSPDDPRIGTDVSETAVSRGMESETAVETQTESDTPSGDSQMLMSSPVTSSESSSGVSSEDDGELIIEEELENPAVGKRQRQTALTREEEDRLLKEYDVKVGTVRTTAEKRFMIQKAPNVLTIQLKRFTQVGYRGGLRKISGHVDFPLHLDLTPFVEPEERCDESEKEQKQGMSRRKRSGGPSLANSNCLDKVEYILTGVSVHGGSLSGGHYTAYVREGVDADFRGGWYYCSDTRIQRASEKDVLSSEAFLLYYERVNY